MPDTRTAQALLRGALLPPDVTPDKTTAYRSSDTTAEATIGNLQVWPARPRVRATTAVTAATASSHHAWHRPLHPLALPLPHPQTNRIVGVYFVDCPHERFTIDLMDVWMTPDLQYVSTATACKRLVTAIKELWPYPNRNTVPLPTATAWKHPFPFPCTSSLEVPLADASHEPFHKTLQWLMAVADLTGYKCMPLRHSAARTVPLRLHLLLLLLLLLQQALLDPCTAR